MVMYIYIHIHILHIYIYTYYCIILLLYISGPRLSRFGPRIQSRQIGEVLPEITRLPGHGMPPMPLRKETHVLRGAGARWGDMGRKVI